MLKKIILVSGVFFLVILSAAVIVKKNLPSQISISKLCANPDNKCPSDYCESQCVGGGPNLGCAGGCVPKDCQKYSADKCPTELCDLMMTGINEKVCYYKSVNDKRSCGDHGYYGQRVGCCEGLVRRQGKVLTDGTCDMTKGGAADKFPYCLTCGNGKCEVLENKCNCPEDCK